MTFKVGIAGSGLIGRLVALACLQRGFKVSLFDNQNRVGGQPSCGWVAAGMLAPYTELESSELLLCQLGLESIKLWPKIIADLNLPVAFSKNGTLIVAHPQDAQELVRIQRVISHKLKDTALHPLEPLTHQQLKEWVPGISPLLQSGFFVKEEAHIDNHAFFKAAEHILSEQVTWSEGLHVDTLLPHQIICGHEKYDFDTVFDCRGLGAKQDLPDLRGIRGEVIWLQTKEVHLHAPVRIMHPRYPIYIAPRPNHCFVIGATSIESDDCSPISTQSMLELLSATYVVHSGFAEARIINTLTQSRPTFSDHLPRIIVSDGLIRINGLYRHGYLAGPAIVHEALQFLEFGKDTIHFPDLFHTCEDIPSCN